MIGREKFGTPRSILQVAELEGGLKVARQSGDKLQSELSASSKETLKLSKANAQLKEDGEQRKKQLWQVEQDRDKLGEDMERLEGGGCGHCRDAGRLKNRHYEKGW